MSQNRNALNKSRKPTLTMAAPIFPQLRCQSTSFSRNLFKLESISLSLSRRSTWQSSETRGLEFFQDLGVRAALRHSIYFEGSTFDRFMRLMHFGVLKYVDAMESISSIVRFLARLVSLRQANTSEKKGSWHAIQPIYHTPPAGLRSRLFMAGLSIS